MAALNNNWKELHESIRNKWWYVQYRLSGRERTDQWIGVEKNKIGRIEVSLDAALIQGNTYGGDYLLLVLGVLRLVRFSIYRLKSKNILKVVFG